MSETSQFLIRHGLPLLFAAVLVEQFGVPIPALPLLLAADALAAVEATAARVALLLQKHGFTRVRPLLGGINAWREQNYPLDTTGSVAVSAIALGSASKPDEIAHPA